jgi:hypothetical protein
MPSMVIASELALRHLEDEAPRTAKITTVAILLGVSEPANDILSQRFPIAL